jgi:hypothetical protein
MRKVKSPGQALDDTLHAFRISGAQIAKQAGLTPSQLSKFKTGKSELRSDNLIDLINALPQEARMHYLAQTIEGINFPN